MFPVLAAHQSLDRKYRVCRVSAGIVDGHPAYGNFACALVLEEAHNRWRQRASLIIGEHARRAPAGNGGNGIGRTEVDTNRAHGSLGSCTSHACGMAPDAASIPTIIIFSSAPCC